MQSVYRKVKDGKSNKRKTCNKNKENMRIWPAKFPGTEKGRKHKKLGIGNNEHVGEGSGTQKSLNFYIVRSQKQNKGRTPKKIKAFVFTNLYSWSFWDKNRSFSVFFHLLCIQHAKKYIEPL